MEFFHYGSSDAASDARRHLDKAAVKFTVFDIFESRYAVFGSVDCHICIVRIVHSHGFKNSACCREETGTAVLFLENFLFRLDVFLFEPCGEFVKGENRVDNSLVILGFVLFCNARTYKYGLGGRISFLYILAVCLHGGENIRKERNFFRKIFLNKKIYRVAAGGNYNVSRFLVYHLVVFSFYNGRPDRSFFNVEESELF